MFATPVPGYLHPMGWQRPAGNLEFIVTRGCKEHLATGVGCALDIGNARQGAPVYAMQAGKVTSRYIQNTPGQVGHGALIMRVTHANGWSSGYAHLQSFSVALNAVVAKGQQIGVLGATGYGISGPHLHTDVKLNGVARDLWPLLDQNIMEDDMDASFEPKPNRTVTVNKGARHRLAPQIADSNVAIAADPGGPLGFALMGTVLGQAVNGNAVWYAYWRPEVDKVYYLHSSTCGPETPWETVPGADCGPAITAATKPLEEQIVVLAATVKEQSDKINQAKVVLA